MQKRDFESLFTGKGGQSRNGKCGRYNMEELKMIISCVVTKGDRKMVRVSFLRGTEGHSMEKGHSVDYAEGILPEGIIEKSRGFTEEEVVRLEKYMRANRQDILRRAKEIDPLRNWMDG